LQRKKSGRNERESNSLFFNSSLPPPSPFFYHLSSLLQLLLGAELVGVSALLLAAVGGARVEAGVAPVERVFFIFLDFLS